MVKTSAFQSRDAATQSAIDAAEKADKEERERKAASGSSKDVASLRPGGWRSSKSTAEGPARNGSVSADLGMPGSSARVAPNPAGGTSGGASGDEKKRPSRMVRWGRQVRAFLLP